MIQKILKGITIIFIVLAILLWIVTIAGWFLTEPGFEPLNVFVSAILSTFISAWSWLKLRKKMSIPETKPAMNTNIKKGIHTDIMVKGGDNVTVNTFPSQLNYLLINTDSPEQRSSYFEQILGLDHIRARYDREQFSAYCDIWKTLQRLKFAADLLWEEANEQNMARFFEQLMKTRRQVHDNALFFKEQHYRKLRSILEEFDAYGLGKEELV